MGGYGLRGSDSFWAGDLVELLGQRCVQTGPLPRIWPHTSPPPGSSPVLFIIPSCNKLYMTTVFLRSVSCFSKVTGPKEGVVGNSRLQPWVRVQGRTAWTATGTCGAEPLICGVQGDSSRIQLNCRAPSRCHEMAWCVCGGRGPTPLVRAVTGTVAWEMQERVGFS